MVCHENSLPTYSFIQVTLIPLSGLSLTIVSLGIPSYPLDVVSHGIPYIPYHNKILFSAIITGVVLFYYPGFSLLCESRDYFFIAICTLQPSCFVCTLPALKIYVLNWYSLNIFHFLSRTRVHSSLPCSALEV